MPAFGWAPVKIFMQWPTKYSYKEFDNEKKFLRLENPPPLPPITFLMVRPGILIFVVTGKSYEDMIDDRFINSLNLKSRAHLTRVAFNEALRPKHSFLPKMSAKGEVCIMSLVLLNSVVAPE